MEGTILTPRKCCKSTLLDHKLNDESEMQMLYKIVFNIMLLSVCFITVSYGGIYKWVDENGTTHYSDKPTSKQAQKIEIQDKTISYRPSPGEILSARSEKSDLEIKYKNSLQRQRERAQRKSIPKTITADDYKITTSVSKAADDYMYVSARVGKGPVCKDMLITAFAQNENGLSARAQGRTQLSTSHGSTMFSEKVLVHGSGNNRGAWKVKTVTVSCYD